MEKDKQDWINKYFEGKLTRDQQVDFDLLLQEDAELAADFQFEKEVREAVIRQERAVLKAELQQLDRQPDVLRRYFGWWKVAAALLLLLGLAGTLWLTLRPTSTGQLYAQYMAPYPNVLAPAVRGAEADASALAEALALYEAEDYAAAAHRLEQLYATSPQKSIAFYRALCLLYLEQPAEALVLLEQWEHEEEGQPVVAVMHWYQALAHLQMNQADEALRFFTLVSQSGDSLATPAGEIIKILKDL